MKPMLKKVFIKLVAELHSQGIRPVLHDSRTRNEGHLIWTHNGRQQSVELYSGRYCITLRLNNARVRFRRWFDEQERLYHRNIAALMFLGQKVWFGDEVCSVTRIGKSQALGNDDEESVGIVVLSNGAEVMAGDVELATLFALPWQYQHQRIAVCALGVYRVVSPGRCQRLVGITPAQVLTDLQHFRRRENVTLFAVERGTAKADDLAERPQSLI